jgi:putative hydroxymethylpyrimidine transport system substrate-binding protein
LIAATLLAAGCGEKSESGAGEPDEFDLALDFYVSADHAGIYTGLANGYFEAAGLDVQPRVPSDPSAPIKQVAAGRSDLAISYEPEVMLARDQGLPVIAVGAIVQKPLTSLISLPAAGIKTPADLEGKSVVTAGIPYQTAYLDTILQDAGVDPATVAQQDVGLNLLPPLLSGSADAMFGGFLNIEGVQLAQDGKNPLVQPVDELGIPTYDELVLVANSDTLDEKESQIRAFIAALERGTNDAEDDPQAATDALLDASPDLDPELTKAQVVKTLPYFEPSPNKPFGYMDPSEWIGFAAFMADQGQIVERIGTAELLTNDLLPGEIPD